MVGELAGVTKRFRGITAVDGVDLRLEAGKVTALLGPNGAGKTTTVRLLLGLTRPTAGTVRLFGQDPTSPAARQRTGVMLQVANVPETLRVREHVHLFCSYYPSPMTVDAALAAAGHRRSCRPQVRRALERAEAARALRARDLRQSRSALSG